MNTDFPCNSVSGGVSIGTGANTAGGLITKKPEQFDFAEALHLMNKGAAVRRYGWNGPHFIQIQHPDCGSKMTNPYIFITSGIPATRVPWIASQTDLLSDDWFIAAPK